MKRRSLDVKTRLVIYALSEEFKAFYVPEGHAIQRVETARQARDLRNQARIEARLLMEDRQKVNGLKACSKTGRPEPMQT